MTTKELSILLLYLLRSRDYIIISDDCRKAIESATDYTNLVHIENESGTVNWKAELLPDCEPGTYRLWSAKDWQTTDNVRAKVRAVAAQMKAEYNECMAHTLRVRTRIIDNLSALGIPREVVEKTMLAKLDTQQLCDMAKGLKIATD
jgi:hypothetical protein